MSTCSVREERSKRRIVKFQSSLHVQPLVHIGFGYVNSSLLPNIQPIRVNLHNPWQTITTSAAEQWQATALREVNPPHDPQIPHQDAMVVEGGMEPNHKDNADATKTEARNNSKGRLRT